ncbi:twin-arginine translocation pathway signal protein [Sulfitobacter sp. SK011]|uniref:Acg family FMN-binding oxidoreductase n=1 Tax=Sulfitobacter sp. SK011 TaxID=1389004 RepID=UPI000E0A1EEA|nr:twin-arginine translocation pathway signal protein [Sulfitobacter sp. SK011]AXI43541.1 twin-arginine translocation pathway signal protein [Sulfitobacter sp. SK011]
MKLSRRKTLALIGGGMVVAAATSATGFLVTRTPENALRPWSLAGSYNDARLNALSFALLAPNPHNLQPWQIEMIGDDRLRVFHDETRRLPETDPFDRQITIGLGCFLEQMVLAAGADGYSVDLALFPDGPKGPIAEAKFNKGGKPDALAVHILDRRSCKEPYEARAVPPELADELRLIADIYTDPTKVSSLRKLTWDAWMVEAMTPRTMQESVDLMRFGKAEINATPDGIDLGGPFLESLMLAGVLTREDQADPGSTGFKEGIKIYSEMLQATPAYAVITTPTNTRQDHIDAGRRWLRLNLATTGSGLALHPVSQALQEYPEMAPHYDAAHAMLAPGGGTVQMLGRLGYGPTVPRTPRWPLKAKLIDG